MQTKPISFNKEMVKAILRGDKTHTRRMVPAWQTPRLSAGPQVAGLEYISIAQRHPRWGFGVFGETPEKCMENYNKNYKSLCPLGKVGDLLWVRETSRAVAMANSFDGIEYLCDGSFAPIEKNQDSIDGWLKMYNYRGKRSAVVPSIHMPRWASRITLEITDVRVERLHDISESDAVAEGCYGFDDDVTGGCTAAGEFSDLWESIYGNWDDNPWVWVIEFTPIFKNVDQVIGGAQ